MVPVFFLSALACVLCVSISYADDAVKKPQETIDKIRSQCMAILEKAMENEDAFVRSAAVRAAGESADPRLIPLLKKGSRDFYPTARLFALQGVKDISDEAAFEIATALLKDTNIWVKSTALEILGDLGNPDSAPLIKEELKSSERMVRLAAAFALYKFGEQKYLSDLMQAAKRGDAVNRYQAISYLGKIDNEEAFALLGELLDDEGDDIIVYSLKAMDKKVGIEHLKRLKELMSHENASVRGQAALALGNLPVYVTLELIKELCVDPDSMVKISAAIAMNRLGSKDCQGVFDESLGDPDFGVRSTAARVMGETPLLDRGRLLARALGDPNSRVRTAAVRATGMMGGAEGFYLLLQMLDDPKEAIRSYAAGNLLKLIR